MRKIDIKHPEWLLHSDQGRTLKLFCEDKLPSSIAGWMLVTSLKHPLRAIYGSDIRAALNLLRDALIGFVTGKWRDFRFEHDWLTAEEREIKAEVEESQPSDERGR